MLRIMDEAKADVLCFGHTHQPYHRVLRAESEGISRNYHAINTGSVGKPKDGDNRGGYVVVSIDQDSSYLDRESIKVEFLRFNYDIEKAARAIEDSSLPNAYAQSLRAGK